MERDLNHILIEIYRERRLDFSQYRPNLILRRVGTRLRATHQSTRAAYLAFLKNNREEMNFLLNALTINVTEFFRDPEVFKCLSKKVIPALLARKKARSQKIVRAWSAGCSNGEEAYSLALLLQKAAAECLVKIHGTDIDPQCIAKAKRGCYGPESLKEVEPALLHDFFVPKNDFFEIKPALKDLTRFQQHDLILDPPLRHTDLILCRNVMIYFTRPLQEKVFSNFLSSLNRGGFLVLGKVETLPFSLKSAFDIVDQRERIYRKK